MKLYVRGGILLVLTRYLCIYHLKGSILREDLSYFCVLHEHQKNRSSGNGDEVEATIYKELRSLMSVVDHT